MKFVHKSRVMAINNTISRHLLIGTILDCSPITHALFVGVMLCASPV
jgi:hypothetical protein